MVQNFQNSTAYSDSSHLISFN